MKMKLSLKPYMYVLPSFVCISIFTYYPFLNSLYLSLFRYNISTPNKQPSLYHVLSPSANLFSSAQQNWAVFNRCFYKEGGDLVPEHTRIRPILHFTEKDLWDTYAAFKIPYCVLYERGYRSLGAKTTSHISIEGVPAWEQDLENTEERAGRRQDKEKAMERMRKLGYM